VVTEFDRVGVSARFEHNEILLGQTLVDVGGQAVEITERRHGSHRAIWKERFEFVFGLQDGRLAGDFLDLFKIRLDGLREGLSSGADRQISP